MPTYLTDLLARVVAIELEAMTSISVQADSKPFFFHTQEDYPYFTHRIVTNSVTDSGSEEIDFNNPTVIVRLIIGHITEGYKGEPEANLYEWLPMLKSFFAKRMWLTSTAYPERDDNLRMARIVDDGGLRAFQDAGINAIQVGAELQLQCIYYELIDQQDQY